MPGERAGRAVRVQVSIDEDLLARIDRVASNRSRFLSDAARAYLRDSVAPTITGRGEPVTMNCAGLTRSEAIGIAKAQLWEEAKGKMRAMVAVEGQCSSHGDADKLRRIRWRAAQLEVEKFVEQFEAEGLHE